MQYDWLDSPASRKLIRVGRRGTKTRFALLSALHGHGPGWEEGRPQFPGVLQGVDVVWIAVTYANLETVLWREEIEPRMGGLDWITLKKSSPREVNFAGLGSLLLRSAEPDAIRSVRGVGKRLGGVIIDEAAWLALSTALKEIILPALLDNGGWLIVMSTTNAGPDGDYDDVGRPMVPSYFNQISSQIARGERGPEWAQFVGTAYDNPTLDRAGIDELVGEYLTDPADMAAYRAGTYDKTNAPIALRQEMFAELIEGGLGLALPGMNAAQHLVAPFVVPSHWPRFAAFDWGFYHPWSFGAYAADEDGAVYKTETVTSRQQLPADIDATVRKAGIRPSDYVIHCGPDIWQARVKTGGEFLGPTIAEALQALGWRILPAANPRVLGLNNFRAYVKTDPAKPDVPPMFRLFDTPPNRIALAQYRAMTLDPKNPEDVLKVDAVSGRGGDDIYDETRYGLMSRPLAARPLLTSEQQGVSLGYDYAAGKPRERETGESMMTAWLSEGQTTPRAGRYRVPR